MHEAAFTALATWRTDADPALAARRQAQLSPSALRRHWSSARRGAQGAARAPAVTVAALAPGQLHR